MFTTKSALTQVRTHASYELGQGSTACLLFSQPRVAIGYGITPHTSPRTFVRETMPRANPVGHFYTGGIILRFTVPEATERKIGKESKHRGE